MIKKIYNHTLDDAHLSISYADDDAISLETTNPNEMWLDKDDVIAMAKHFNLGLMNKGDKDD